MAKMYTMPGAPSELDVAKTQAAAMTEKGPTNKYVWYTTSANQKGYDTEFPVVPFRADPHDDIWNIKQDASASTDMDVVFTDADAQYQMRKRTDDEQARFDAWISQTFNLNDPAQNAMLQQIVPGLYQRREQLIDHLQDLQTRYAKIRLRGAKSEEDLRFQWLIDTGRIELPAAAIWDPVKWKEAVAQKEGKDLDATMAVRYQRGYFSPLSWIMTGKTGSAAKETDYFDIRGNRDRDYSAGGVGATRNPVESNNTFNSQFFPGTTQQWAGYQARLVKEKEIVD